MDAEMALVMCNHARVQHEMISLFFLSLWQVKRGSLVIDPFVGTGSILVAAAHFGCVTVGCDIDAKILRQQKKNKGGESCSIWSNFRSYGLPCPIGLLICDMHRAPFGERPLEVSQPIYWPSLSQLMLLRCLMPSSVIHHTV